MTLGLSAINSQHLILWWGVAVGITCSSRTGLELTLCNSKFTESEISVAYPLGGQVLVNDHTHSLLAEKTLPESQLYTSARGSPFCVLFQPIIAFTLHCNHSKNIFELNKCIIIIGVVCFMYLFTILYHTSLSKMKLERLMSPWMIPTDREKFIHNAEMIQLKTYYKLMYSNLCLRYVGVLPFPVL